MKLQDYIKLRCDLNNLNYREVPYGTASIKTEKTKINKDLKILKEVKDAEDNIKYTVTYYLYDYSDHTWAENIDDQFRVHVAACFYIFRSQKEKTVQSNSNITYLQKKYDTVNISYHIAEYRQPKEVEELFETFWNSYSAFERDPYGRLSA